MCAWSVDQVKTLVCGSSEWVVGGWPLAVPSGGGRARRGGGVGTGAKWPRYKGLSGHAWKLLQEQTDMHATPPHPPGSWLLTGSY